MGTASAEPHIYVYRLLFQAQICGTLNPVDLSLERLTTRFSVSNQSMPVFSISNERTKNLKATDDEILDAVDGILCNEQADKLRIIREHMSNLDLCMANLQSVILSTAEKYTNQINLI